MLSDLVVDVERTNTLPPGAGTKYHKRYRCLRGPITTTHGAGRQVRASTWRASVGHGFHGAANCWPRYDDFRSVANCESRARRTPLTVSFPWIMLSRSAAELRGQVGLDFGRNVGPRCGEEIIVTVPSRSCCQREGARDGWGVVGHGARVTLLGDIRFQTLRAGHERQERQGCVRVLRLGVDRPRYVRRARPIALPGTGPATGP